MDVAKTQDDLGISSRLRRSRGRPGRVIAASTKVTQDEQTELEGAAKREGKAFSEWAREVLLREARSGGKDTALFTEVVALRMSLTAVLRNLAVGDKMTPESYAKVQAEVRITKHDTARDVLAQYERRNEGR